MTGAFPVDQLSEAGAFSISGIMSSYAVRGDSGSPVTRRFCARCSAVIYLESEAYPGYVFLSAGSLDEADWLVPEAHFYTRCKQPWLSIDDDLPKHDTVPGV
jgi:hypothetical protein